jgi:hypothetical protein
LSLDCDFAGPSYPVLDRHWDLVCEVSAVGSAAVGIQTLSVEVSALKTEIGQKLNLNLNLNDRVLEQLSRDFSELRKEVLTLKAQISGMLPTVTSSETCSCFVQFFSQCCPN